jgi:hypothetical protein
MSATSQSGPDPERRGAGPEGGRPGPWAHVGLAAVLALAAWARLTGFRAAFPGGAAMGIDGDSDYHVRRMLAALHGSIPTFDPLMNWPAGGPAPWADGFDWLGAAFAWLAGGTRSPEVATAAALALPVIVGVVTVWGTVELTRALAPRGDHATPLAAGLVAAVIPQFVAISVYGRADHHIAEALSMVWLAIWALRRFPRTGVDPWAGQGGAATDAVEARDGAGATARDGIGLEGRDGAGATARDGIGLEGRDGIGLEGRDGAGAAGRGDREGPGWRWELAGAAAVASALWLFSGGVLYVGIAAVPLGIAVLAARRPPGIVGSGAPALLGGACLGAALTVPAIRGHGHAFSFMFPSLLQPALVALAGVAVGAAVLAGRRLGERHRLRRLVAALVALGATAAAAWLLLPALRAEVTSAVRGWLLAQDPWLADVMEFQPLLSPRGPGGGGIRSVRYHFGAAGLLGAAAFPIAIVMGAVASRARAAVYAWTSVALGGLTLLQLRFGRVVAPFIAVAIALALLAGARLLGRFLPWPRLLGVAPLVAAATVVLASPTLRRQLAVFGPPELDALRHASTDLRLERPPRLGARDGVLVPWDYGHTLSALSGRPVVSNGFGSYLDAASFADVKAAFLGDEARLVATMDRYDLGWLLAGGSILVNHQPQPDNLPPAVGNPRVLNPEYMLAMPLSQLLIAGSGLPGPGLPHLEHLMPVFASRAVAGQLGFPLPVVWTFERVAGAVLAGQAAPGTQVVAEIQLVEWGRPHRYRAWTDAGADGSWRIRVALPSGLFRSTLRSGPAWTVDVGGGHKVEVEVPEEAVRSGREIAVAAPGGR